MIGVHKVNIKIVNIIIIISFLVVGCIVIFILQQKRGMNNVGNISIIAKDENLNVQISNLSDVMEVNKILSKRTVYDSPSCPFGYVEILVNQDNDKMLFFPATDSCHIIKVREKYLHLSDGEWEKFIQILGKYGIDRSLVESGKGI